MNPLTDLAARLVIAHRGDSAHFPENTMPSFERAVALGVDALEFDVRLTADGVAVVVHDATLDRTTSGHGPVAATPLGALRALDAGARYSADGGRTFPFRGTGLIVPTLEEMLERFPEIPLLIEVKVPEAVPETRRLLERHGAVRRTLVDSTDARAVEPFRDGLLATGASFDDVFRLMRRAGFSRVVPSLPYDALCIPRWYYGVPIPVRRLAAMARSAEVVTHVWTVNDTRIAETLWEWEVNGIITDDPSAMVAVRDRLSRRAR
jgi:glycerophosphoryl diester phosphodiesterase